jgi:hypothetical protein
MLIGRGNFAVNKRNLDNPSEEIVKEKISQIFGGKKVFPIGDRSCEQKDFLPLNSGRLSINKNERQLNKKFGIKGLCHPIDHVDQYISLAGRRKEDGKYVLLVAEAVLKNNKFDDWGGDIFFKLEILNEQLDGVATYLKEQGFFIIRNPMPKLGIDEYALYNNCLVEIDKKNKQVWLPAFGREDSELTKFDHQNIVLWQLLGFKVHSLHGLLTFSKSRGTIHCLTKELLRK